MYGLPQAGRLTYFEFFKFFAAYGYFRAGITPCLFKHVKRKTTFSLVFDDLGVKYNSQDDAFNIINTLQKLYKFTINWEGNI